jgi:CRISPR-associated protein Cas5t
MNSTLILRLEAPFAACRNFAAGWFRPAAPFLTHSAAYGLLMNIAGIETRLWEHDPKHLGNTPASLFRNGLPACKLALAVPPNPGNNSPAWPIMQTNFQQLHNYPVGNSGAELKKLSHGQKYNITPVRRQFLSDLRALVAIEGPPELIQRIRDGLAGKWNSGGVEPTGDARYGLPFLGDNQFILSRLEEPRHPASAFWLCKLAVDEPAAAGAQVMRLTSWIDRAGMAGTKSDLWSATAAQSIQIPAKAWQEIVPPG